MDAEKDRLGDKLRDLEHARENQYFADRDKELLAKLRDEPALAAVPACPVCGNRLALADRAPVCSLSCPAGHGLWIAAEDLKAIADPDLRAILERLLAAGSARA
jgi:hypothetical protein